MQKDKGFLRGVFLSKTASRFLAALVSAFLLCAASAMASDSDKTVESPPGSLNYVLTGIAQVDGVSYASLIDPQTKKHYVLSSDTPGDGWTLISIATDADPSGPSAIIERNGLSVRLRLVSGAIPNTSRSSSISDSNSNATILPQGVSASVDAPTPPAGASLPLVFQAVDRNKLELSDEQQQAINQLRQDFLKAVNGTSQGNNVSSTNSANSSPTNNQVTSKTADSAAATSSSSTSDTGVNSTSANNPTANGQSASTGTQQGTNWQTAQEQSDELLRTLIGWQAFSAYQLSLLK